MKKIISVSSILAILLSQAGCIGGKPQPEETAETEKMMQKQANTSSQQKGIQMITLTNKETGQKIEISLEEFKKISRQEFAKKLGVSDEEVDELSEEEFERTKQAIIEWEQLMAKDFDATIIDKVQDFEQRSQDVIDSGRMNIRQEVNVSIETDKSKEE